MTFPFFLLPNLAVETSVKLKINTLINAHNFILTLLILSFSGAVLAQAPAPVASDVTTDAPLKIAILDMAAALFNSDVAKKVDEEVQAQTADDAEKVRLLAEEATTLQKKLQTDASVMSEDEKRKANEQIQEIGVQYQFLVEKVQKVVGDRRQQFQDTYAPNLIQAITAVVEEDDFDLVFRSEAVLHYRTAFDITARVTEKLNQQK
jgi:outer membrane protein